MNVQIKIVENYHDLSIEELISERTIKFSTHPLWMKIIYNSFKNNVFVIIAKNNNKTLGYFPLVFQKSRLFGKYLISMPYLNYGGPVASNYDIKIQLLNEAINLAKKLDVDFLEVREDQRCKWPLHEKMSKIKVLLDLPAKPEILWDNFKSKLRNQIRRPMREGMFFKIGSTNLLNDFYHCFSINMKELGTPVYAKKFFHNILVEFPQNTKVGVVYSENNKPVTAGVIFHFGEIVEIPWASSIKKYNRFSPNMLLYWEFINFAILNNYSYFDFGRCSKGSGTHKFKLQWGGYEKQLYWYYWLPSDNKSLPELNPSNAKYRILIYIWRHIPLWLSKFIGPRIVKNLP